MLSRLGDRVTTWTTFNEPWCTAFLGYAAGKHAPGRTEPDAAVAAAHHLLLAHGTGLGVIRSHAPNAHAGLTLNLFPVAPADPDDPADADAARRVDGLQNRIFLDPLLTGSYPADVLEDLPALADHVQPGDLERISAPIDLLGVNYYRDLNVSGNPDERSGPPSPWVGADHVSFPSRQLPRTDMDWEVNPGGLTDLLVDLDRRYPGMTYYVTENGVAYRDVLSGGSVDDVDRVEFLVAHLRAAHAAIELGVDLRGYFYWSLLDNFEWAEGYAKRFGLVHVDYETQRRTPKLSAARYARVIADNGV